MKRVIVDYEKLTTNVLELLVEHYPNGYFEEDIISFKTSKGETIRAIEVREEDTIYLVKISAKLDKKMENYYFDEEEKDDSSEDDFDMFLRGFFKHTK